MASSGGNKGAISGDTGAKKGKANSDERLGHKDGH